MSKYLTLPMGVGIGISETTVSNLIDARITGADNYLGTWNAATNTPTITQGSGTNNNYYIVKTGGTWDGMKFNTQDYVIFSANTNKWERVGKDDVLNTLKNLADEYSSTSTYSAGDVVIYEYKLYKCISNITTPESWTAAHWTQTTVAALLELKSTVAAKTTGTSTSVAKYLEIDGIEYKLSGGISSGTAFPTSPENDEWFYLKQDITNYTHGLYQYDQTNSKWVLKIFQFTDVTSWPTTNLDEQTIYRKKSENLIAKYSFIAAEASKYTVGTTGITTVATGTVESWADVKTNWNKTWKDRVVEDNTSGIITKYKDVTTLVSKYIDTASYTIEYYYECKFAKDGILYPFGNTEEGGGSDVSVDNITIGKNTTSGKLETKEVKFEQTTAATTWTINHNLQRYPSVRVLDSAGDVIYGEVSYTTNNSMTINFATAESGIAYLL